MENGRHVPIEEMEVFQRYVEIADWAWDTVNQWPSLAIETMGRQLIRSLDSVGANLVEGDGRHGSADALHFFIIARASAREARYWLQRAIRRKLLSDAEGNSQIAALTGATQLLNRLIAYSRRHANDNRVNEPRATYEPDTDPFTIDEHLNT
jgi:four helix bundle protein